MKLTKKSLVKLERIFRLNLVNSVSGIKPANLIGTKSKSGNENLAIISSVVHLGSNPAQLGFILRPQVDKISDTYKNIKETEFYSINHINKSLLERAHYTSAKLNSSLSEFDEFNIEKEYIGNFNAPFVNESSLKIGMRLIDFVTLPNDCIFVIGSIELLIIPDNSINKSGQIDLSYGSTLGISGLNTYYTMNKIKTLPYIGKGPLPNIKVKRKNK